MSPDILIGRSDTRQGKVGTFSSRANHSTYPQPRTALVVRTRDYPRFHQQTHPTRILATAKSRYQSTDSAIRAFAAREKARAVREALACACGRIVRSSFRASRGYARCRRRWAHRQERSPAHAHSANVRENHHPMGKASPKRRAATHHLPRFIAANKSAVRIEIGPGSVLGTALVAGELA